MGTIGIRELKQNASAAVARAAAGETLTVTDRGRPAAQLSPLPTSPLARLLESGSARPARTDLADLPSPVRAAGGRSALSDALADLRSDER
ncbi:type II toxin-antitoxin system prevent-host-death family antitoxin [Cellulomonas sp. zg-ZUI199]|uniref:Type II toxin-antitoxin system prevent-host-death family antitoxin n=1 Tax=Cellulomonas wangleii TaxID=2816956 RepID=A0ABX8D7R9_9CELL|nr:MULTISPECIES: type II toxin-antitoxin system prevent-host-death family antitoxin [Cellulomonas]MBO0898918.1 type II toxin-antitoxin system prevent-host-death family antitoxin [Cellulomonas sp. zg-ZUI22]MBO0923795.1 type II toxin-antitoxin system prevent-host-death family antitoxin [Cellulomonas wangleii]MBO0924077.1 type II toxin-antitoxin system prevent-host-death family antitoxin [Cellulomonas wangleii]QVI62102.1 type II toxin-antitoxin system prevent-host-death family antitoxin [Cellulomo